MSNGKEIRKITMHNFCKLLFMANATTETEVAKKIGKSRQTISTKMRNGRMNISSLVEILGACGEPFVLQTRTGEAFEIELKDQKDE